MHIAIIGNGISGITAARYIRKLSGHKITVISRETDFFFSRTALMYIYMGHMRFKDTKPYEDHFWEKNDINLIRGSVASIDFDSNTLHFEQDFICNDSVLSKAPSHLQYDRLILALGSSPNKFGWPGQDLQRVHGLYTMQDLMQMEKLSKDLERAVIVGGGLIGIEMAEMFHSRKIPVTMLVRESSFWDMVLPAEESAMVNQQIRIQDIDLRLDTELEEIVGNDQGQAVRVKTNHGDSIDCQYVGLTAGVHPNVQWLKDSPLDIDRGILVNEYLQTNLNGVYAIGDCAQLHAPDPGRKNIEAVWYTGRMMGETAAYTICGVPTEYHPGIWFNSAKFFDIEYQVYGNVPVDISDDHDSLFWQDDDRERSIRIVYSTDDQVVIGFNLMGVRFRQEVCEKWIRDHTPIAEVMRDLVLANFDPEFSPYYHRKLQEVYEQKTGKVIEPQLKPRRFDSVFKFLKKEV